MNIEPMTLHTAMRAALEKKGWSQSKLADEMGVSRQYISRILDENQPHNFTVDQLEKFAQVCGLNLTLFFSDRSATPQSSTAKGEALELTPNLKAILCIGHWDLHYHGLLSACRSVMASRRPFFGNQSAVLTATLDELQAKMDSPPPKWPTKEEMAAPSPVGPSDKEMLDWLEKGARLQVWPEGWEVYRIAPSGTGMAFDKTDGHPTARQAITAAMRPSPKGYTLPKP